MNPYTGEVLALANYPTYDPNERMKPGQNLYGREDYAVVAPFEPGSVFKIVTLSAALETTNLRPSTIIDCGNGSIRIGNRIVHDSPSSWHLVGGRMCSRIRAISARSASAWRSGMRTLYNYIQLFGFGHRTGIELPAEAPGLVRPAFAMGTQRRLAPFQWVKKSASRQFNWLRLAL